jgi:BMFP domain-containing protein YqiC
MAAKARAEQETLARRVAALEARLGAKAGKAAKLKKGAKRSTRKGTAKKA